MKKKSEIMDRAKEAFDKVWLMNTKPVPEFPDIEQARLRNIERIRNTYKDIPEEGYNDYDRGYWNGVLDTLRWVTSNEKDSSSK